MTPEHQAILDSFHKALPALLSGNDPQPICYGYDGQLVNWDHQEPPRIAAITSGDIWDNREKRVMLDYYPAGKGRVCTPMLPGRTPGAILAQAVRMGLCTKRRLAAAPKFEVDK